MKRKLLYQIILSLLFVFVAQQFNSCKKVDLERTALVKTNSVTDVTANSATVSGTIVDLGEGQVTEYGFSINDQLFPVTAAAKLGSYSATLTGLNESTQYAAKSYLKSGGKEVYGENISFTTKSINPSNSWLKYDDGENFDGLGLNAGGDFDVAIRFTPTLLAPYDGWKITKIKFFPKVGLPVAYSLEIYDGTDISTLTLKHLQDVTNPTINAWNEITLNTSFTINAANELLVGYWVQNSAAATYPAGCDAGPAVAEYGDLISVDGGTTWYSLSTAAPALNYNWNIQVYVVSPGGIEKQLSVEEQPAPVRVPFVAREFNSNLFGSSKQSFK